MSNLFVFFSLQKELVVSFTAIDSKYLWDKLSLGFCLCAILNNNIAFCSYDTMKKSEKMEEKKDQFSYLSNQSIMNIFSVFGP